MTKTPKTAAAKKTPAKAAPKKPVAKAAAIPAAAPAPKRVRPESKPPYTQAVAAAALGITPRALVELAKTGHVTRVQVSQRKRYYTASVIDRLAKKLAR